MTRLMYVLKNCHLRYVSVIIIIFGFILAETLLPLPSNISSQERNTNPDKLLDIGSYRKIQRLVSVPDSLSNNRREILLDSISSGQESQLTPLFDIDSQIGTGGGVYQAYDSANLTSGTNLDVNDNDWRTHPEEHENSITITIPSGYTNQSGYFNISGISALPDWRLVENKTTGATQRQSDSFFEAAQEFRVDESDLNLTKISLFIDMVDNDGGDGQKPNGEFLVLGDNSGEPNSTDVKGKLTLETHPTLAGISDGFGWSATSNGWLNYTISPAIHLIKGTYWLALNDTTRDSGIGMWRWYTQPDGSGNLDKGEWNYKLFAAWTEWPNVDMVIMPQVLPVEFKDSSYVNKNYSSPQSLDFLYRTSADDTNLTSFSWFGWNGTSDNIHYFLTNTSVNFTISWRINITYSNNPLPITASFLTVNNSISQWNLTFTSTSITTSYNIRNRTITVNGLENDWNGSSISLGGSLNYNITASGGLNASVTYSNQSTAMIINASTLAVVTDWNITFDAPNYILEFNVSLGGTTLELPYQTFTMNDYSLDFKVGETGNLTYWIDYPNGSQRLKNDINNTHTLFGDLWDINNTFDNISDVNGTYYLQAFWNNSDSSKVGTFTREASMIVNTTFDYEYEAEVILDTHLDIIIQYNSTHNATLINNASVTGVPSWGTSPLIEFNHTVAQDPYMFSIEINDSQHNPGDIISIDILAEFPGFVNYSATVYVKVVSDATLGVNTSQDLVLEWRENRTIEIKYNQTGGSGVEGAMITVDGDSTNVYNISNVYYYRLNSTEYGGVDTYLNLNITASHPNYITKIWYFDLTITLGYTNITGSHNGNPLINDTTVITQPFANSSADNVIINLQYYHDLTGDNLSTNIPTIVSPIPVSNTIKDGSDFSWSLTFNPNKTDVFLINIAFYLNNYMNSTFFFHLTVVKAGTAIESKPLVDIPVYYTEYFDFFLLYNNTDYNENITGLIIDSGFTIDNSKVVDVNQTDEGYWFRFNPSPSILPLGRHSINITFYHDYFNPSFIEVTFIVVNMPTKPLDITNFRYNQSILVEDVLYIDGDGYQSIRGQNISNHTVVLRMNDTLVMESFYNYQTSQNRFVINFTTTSFHYGNYSLTVEIDKVGYQNQTINFNITLQGRKTTLEVTLPGKKFEQGDPIKITAVLTYVQKITGGLGAGLSLAPLEAVNVSFYIELKYENATTQLFELTNQTDGTGETSFIIDGKYTLGAVGFTNITVWSSPGLSGLPSSYSMSKGELDEFQIIKIIDPLEIIISVIIIGSISLLFVAALAGSSIFLNRKRKQRSELILRKRRKIEQSFEDIKSIRLLIARHESGLQFYSEKTISELQTDTDALSGMSAALSTFMEEVSDGMRSRTDEEKAREKIEVMSREGLHMLIWHGSHSSFIIISETRLPEYFKERLAKLGREVENKFAPDLDDFYRSDQIPSVQIKKMIRNHIPLHYFSAFILNEGVVTLESIKLSKKEKKMLNLIKQIRFQKEGVQFFFSEQIISHLTKHFKRSEAIKFLDRSIEINLLIEASPEDMLSITK